MATGGSLIGALRVTLGLDTAQFEAGSKRARGMAKRDISELQSTMNGLKNTVQGLLGGAVVGSIVAAAQRALDYASSLGEVAQQLGVTSSELQQYRYVASQVGVSTDEMDNALSKLTRNIGEAGAGSKAQVAAFRELGVSITDSSGRIKTAGELIPALADAFARIPDPATRARIQVDLFGKSGQKLDPLLTQGAKGVNALRDAAHSLGIVLSDEQIQNADNTADKLSELKMVLESNIAGAVANNARAIYGYIDSLVALIATIPNAIRSMQNFGDEFRIGVARGRQNVGKLLPGLGLQESGRLEAGQLKRGIRTRNNLARIDEAASKLERAGYVVPRNADGTVNQGGIRRRPATPLTNLSLPSPAVAGTGGGGRGRSKGGSGSGGGESDAARAAKAEATALQDLYDRLYPDAAKDRAFLEDLTLLEKVAKGGGDAADKAKDAMAALFAEARAEIDKSSFVDDLAIEVGDLSEAIAQIPIETVTSWEATMDANAKLARSFVDTAQDVRYSLQTLVDDIKKGDFLGILDSALRVFESLRGGSYGGPNLLSSLGGLFGGGKGGFSRSFADNATSSALAGLKIPGLATGGSFRVGGAPGVDRNVLSVNGMPAVRVSANERVSVERDGGMGRIAHIVPSPYFNVVVRGEAAGVVNQAAPSMISGGGDMAIVRQQRMAGRRLA